MLNRGIAALSAILALVSVFNATLHEAKADITAVLTVSAPEQVLKTWNSQQLQGLKRASKSEKDPLTGKVAAWDGVLLTDFIDKSLDGLDLNKKAQIDLIILKDASGAEALIPRSFVNKYPLILATKKDHQALNALHAVVPWTSQPKTTSEELPIERYFVPNVVRVEFGNYREKYRAAFLSRRTDPSAMKGEKLYVQSCLSCHASGSAEAVGAKARTIASSEHPAVKGLPKMDDRSRRALKNYFDELGNEAAATRAPQAANQ